MTPRAGVTTPQALLTTATITLTEGVTQTDWCPEDIVDEWGVQSFPASDPPANW